MVEELCGTKVSERVHAKSKKPAKGLISSLYSYMGGKEKVEQSKKVMKE